MATATKTAKSKGRCPTLPSDRDPIHGPLPPGRHGLPRQLVFENQRSRLLHTAAALNLRFGFEETSVSAIAGRAHVSTKTFYEMFAGKSDCLAAAQAYAFESFRAELAQARASVTTWPDQLRAAVGAALEFAAREPALAFLLLPDPESAEGHVGPTLRVLNDFLCELLHSGRADVETVNPPALTEFALIAAARSLVGSYLRSGRAAELPAIRADLTQFLLTPYLGAAEAAGISASASPLEQVPEQISSAGPRFQRSNAHQDNADHDGRLNRKAGVGV